MKMGAQFERAVISNKSNKSKNVNETLTAAMGTTKANGHIVEWLICLIVNQESGGSTPPMTAKNIVIKMVLSYRSKYAALSRQRSRSVTD